MLHALIDRRKPRRGSAQRPDDPNIRCPPVRDLLHASCRHLPGRPTSLRDVIADDSTLDVERLHSDSEALLRPLRLDAGQAADLLAFLLTLPEPEPHGPP